MIDEVKERARELIKLGNDIEEKIEKIRKLEQDVEKLQIYRNERGDQLLHTLMETDTKKEKNTGV